MISDWDCLDRARRGDEAAWRMLFQRHYPALFRSTLFITGSREAGIEINSKGFSFMSL